jgi:hypothetical protein
VAFELKFVQDVQTVQSLRSVQAVTCLRQFNVQCSRVQCHRYLHWVFEAKKRYGLSVLDYMVTSNHIRLLVKDTGQDVIAQSMQLIAGRMAQEYNHRKAAKQRSGKIAITPRLS